MSVRICGTNIILYILGSPGEWIIYMATQYFMQLPFIFPLKHLQKAVCLYQVFINTKKAHFSFWGTYPKYEIELFLIHLYSLVWSLLNI